MNEDDKTRTIRLNEYQSDLRVVLPSLDLLVKEGMQEHVEVEAPFIERLLASDAFKAAVEKIVDERILGAREPQFSSVSLVDQIKASLEDLHEQIAKLDAESGAGE